MRLTVNQKTLDISVLYNDRWRVIVAWCLLAFWLTGSVQASVHGALMSSQLFVGQTTSLMHSHAAEPEARMSQHWGHGQAAVSPKSTHGHTDLPCVELCLLISLTPLQAWPAAVDPGSASYTELTGDPVSLNQPAIPPPRILLF